MRPEESWDMGPSPQRLKTRHAGLRVIVKKDRAASFDETKKATGNKAESCHPSSQKNSTGDGWRQNGKEP